MEESLNRLRRWEQENPERAREAQRRWAQQNRDKISAKNRRQYLKRHNHNRMRAKRYYREHKAEILSKAKATDRAYKWAKANPEKAAALKARQLQKNKTAEHRAKIREWTRNRRINNPQFLLASQLRCRINVALKKSGAFKSAKTCELLGCDVPFLRRYLEERFLPGMSWQNRSAWHIDHIIPCSAFDLTNPAQQRRCFNYTNLQPLWASDNCKKDSTREARARRDAIRLKAGNQWRERQAT